MKWDSGYFRRTKRRNTLFRLSIKHIIWFHAVNCATRKRSNAWLWNFKFRLAKPRKTCWSSNLTTSFIPCLQGYRLETTSSYFTLSLAIRKVPGESLIKFLLRILFCKSFFVLFTVLIFCPYYFPEKMIERVNNTNFLNFSSYFEGEGIVNVVYGNMTCIPERQKDWNGKGRFLNL